MRAQLPDTIPSICDSYIIVMCSDDCVHLDCQLLFFAVFTIICAAHSCFKSMCSLVSTLLWIQRCHFAYEERKILSLNSLITNVPGWRTLGKYRGLKMIKGQELSAYGLLVISVPSWPSIIFDGSGKWKAKEASVSFEADFKGTSTVRSSCLLGNTCLG